MNDVERLVKDGYITHKPTCRAYISDDPTDAPDCVCGLAAALAAMRMRWAQEYITVQGAIPGLALQIGYAPTPEALQMILASVRPMPPEEWDAYALRTKWMSHLAWLCSAVHPESAGEFGAFLSNSTPPLVTVVVWVTPPVVVNEVPFVVSDTTPTAVRRPTLLGPDGEPLSRD